MLWVPAPQTEEEDTAVTSILQASLGPLPSAPNGNADAVISYNAVGHRLGLLIGQLCLNY